MAEPIYKVLKNYWGYDAFRPLQEDIINSILNGQDTLALLPTGGGKSICFQVPAMAKEGLCLVISPLIALMKDQVENLRRKGITAYAIFSGMSRKEVINVLEVAMNSNCKFLYVSPERLETRLFKEYLPALNINLIAVDEAHCISQWGYDFRPPYRRIAALREEIARVPVLALSASATTMVQEDICKQLEFKGHQVFRQSFSRPNLSYSAFNTDSKINRILEILQKVPGTSLVYCKSRKRTKFISDLLTAQGIKSDFYHAGLSQEDRSRKQESWIKNETRTIVCTNAFGMGIDKPDVRLVIHADTPDCLENYYQEAGRAGRDGKKSYAVLLYDGKELVELKNQPATRFPGIYEIRKVYQALVNYLQIPTGLGEGRYYDFDLNDFLKKFKLDTQLVIHALKALEQEEMMSFNEQVFLPARVQFICDKNTINNFENTNPADTPLIKVLLRTYEGIFDQPTPIFEKNLSYLLKSQINLVKDGLKKLQAYGIINYQPQKDKPQLLLIQDRIREDQLRINQELYQQRKKQFEERINSMIEFATTTSACRSTYIGLYFGDTEMTDCGICDNCLKKKSLPLTAAEFESIHLRISETVSKGKIAGDDFFRLLRGIRKDKLLKVLEFLQAENKIFINERDEISLSKHK
ncbi:MAG: RecQ family ATP-dependent DNA helicase [Chitinophagaceae bacterium]|nr:MAG: RecQ family ATP-dependent DNA helicase [Chitinophagaceae bacterium]